MITFAGQPLGIVTDSLSQWWSTYLSISGIEELWDCGFPSGGVHPDTPTPSQRIPRNQPIQLNTLYWPTGLSRFGKFHGIVDQVSLALIQLATANNIAGELIIKEDDANYISTNMYLLSARPIAKVGNLPDTEFQLYLITLVDKRYYYYQQTGVIDNITSWDSWFTEAYGLLSATADIGTIPATYQVPSYKFVCQNKPIPLMIDAAARLLGFRIEYHLDGTIEHKQWETALLEANTLHLALVNYKVAGEFMNQEDLAKVAPASFKALFKSTDNTFTTFTKSLSSLSIPEYDGYGGTTGNYGIYYSDYIYVHNTADYNTDCQNLTNEAAYDYYGWSLMPADISYAGIVDWDALASADYVQWSHDNKLLTRIVREPFWIAPPNDAVADKETQIIRVPSDAESNDSDDLFGYVQEYDYLNNDWYDSYSVWLRSTSDTPVLKGKRYLSKFLYYPLESKNLYVAANSAGDGGEVWMRVTTPLPTADPGPYTGVKGKLTAGVWADESPTVTYDTVYRAPSNITPPKIPANQYVRLIPSPTMTDAYEIAAVGGMQTVEFFADLDWGCKEPQKVELTGRDLSVVVTAGGTDEKIITCGPFVTDVTFNTSTCVITVTKMNLELNLCDLTGTFVSP